jgi:hypothetical protein
MNGLPEGLEIVRLDPAGAAHCGTGEYLLSRIEEMELIVRPTPGYQMVPSGIGQYRPVRTYDEPKRLEFSFDGFAMSFEILNEAQDEALRETLEHLRHKLLTRIGLAEIVDGIPEGVYS